MSNDRHETINAADLALAMKIIQSRPDRVEKLQMPLYRREAHHAQTFIAMGYEIV